MKSEWLCASCRRNGMEIWYCVRFKDTAKAPTMENMEVDRKHRFLSPCEARTWIGRLNRRGKKGEEK